MYKNELKAIKRSKRFRSRKIFDEDLYDFASNDYLGFANNQKLFKKAYRLVNRYKTKTPKASMLVNGYHQIHKDFEDKLCEVNQFQAGIIVGSGFLANLSLIEALVRKNDMLFMDEDYHASGVVATNLLRDRVIFFKHNNPQDLKEKLQTYGINSKRNIIAVEGVYSMSGNVCNKEIIDIANETNSILIVDEAHSSGVIGKNLLGLYDYYDIEIRPNHIKMGTLGKAYGSYGAYILSSQNIIDFLVNRAKPIIYSTAPSIFDTALGLINFQYLIKHKKRIKKRIKSRQKIIKQILNLNSYSLIIAIKQKDNKSVIEKQQKLIESGFLVGAIRQPTVNIPIIRVIPRLGESKKRLKQLLSKIV